MVGLNPYDAFHLDQPLFLLMHFLLNLYYILLFLYVTDIIEATKIFYLSLNLKVLSSTKLVKFVPY